MSFSSHHPSEEYQFGRTNECNCTTFYVLNTSFTDSVLLCYLCVPVLNREFVYSYNTSIKLAVMTCFMWCICEQVNRYNTPWWRRQSKISIQQDPRFNSMKVRGMCAHYLARSLLSFQCMCHNRLLVVMIKVVTCNTSKDKW